MREAGSTRANYRGAPVAYPAGLAIPVVALLALVPLALLQELAGAKVFRPEVGPAVTYVVGVSLLGLLDDLLGGDPSARGWRGHARARGRGPGSGSCSRSRPPARRSRSRSCWPPRCSASFARSPP